MLKFEIAIYADDGIFRGLKALDLRRKLGLPDALQLLISSQDSEKVEVSESFARKHNFQQQQLFSRAMIILEDTEELELVEKGDFKPTKNSSDCEEEEKKYYLNPSIQSRIIELYTAL